MIKLSQSDSKWRRVKMGVSNLTLGGYGCTTTCQSIVSHAAGQYISPADFARQNDNYTNHSYSAGAGLVLWTEFTKDMDNVQKEVRVRRHDEDMFRDAINSPNEILMLELKTNYAKYPIHWVIAEKALGNGDYQIIDVVDGKIRKVSDRYVKVIGGCVVVAKDGFIFDKGEESVAKEYDNYLVQDSGRTGGFALVYRGEKHLIKSGREGVASLTVTMRDMKHAGLSAEVWDAIPTGSDV